MNETLKLYTIQNGRVENGAWVDTLKLQNAEVTIPAIMVGSVGRGRSRGIITVNLLPAEHEQWHKEGQVKIFAVQLSETRTGNPKFIQAPLSDSISSQEFIGVFYTKIGFRGGNSHTGDRLGLNDSGKIIFDKFPGFVLAEGTIAEGAAGMAGSGQQLIAKMPAHSIFRTGYSGRLYGEPPAHYYQWDGQDTLLSMSWEERVAADLF